MNDDAPNEQQPAEAEGLASDETAAPTESIGGDEPVADQQAESGEPAAVTMPSFEAGESGELEGGLDLLADVNLTLTVELGRTRMLVEDVLRLSDGAVVELDKLAGDPVDIYVNDRPIARGEVLVLNDNFCIRISEILAAIKAEAVERAA